MKAQTPFPSLALKNMRPEKANVYWKQIVVIVNEDPNYWLAKSKPCKMCGAIVWSNKKELTEFDEEGFCQTCQTARNVMVSDARKKENQ